MDEKELPCGCCVHKNVCKFKKDFADVISALNNTNISQRDSDGKIRTGPIKNFAFLVTIATSCNFFKEDY